MRRRKIMQDFVNRFFGHHPPGSPLTEETRRMLECSIQNIVHSAIRRRHHRRLSRADVLIRAMAAQISMEASDVSDIDETDLIENICRQILKCVVSDITNCVPTEKRAVDTGGREWEPTELNPNDLFGSV